MESRRSGIAPADAERYSEELADARMVLIEDAYSFTPEDQPGRLAEEIVRFGGVEGTFRDVSIS